jgi:hypothetical protein
MDGNRQKMKQQIEEHKTLKRIMTLSRDHLDGFPWQRG